MAAARSRRPRRLTDDEIAAYDLLAPDLARRVRVVRIPAVIGRYSGITLVRFVLVTTDIPADGASKLIAHELVHVRQWSELGIVGFLARYLGAFVRNLRTERSWRRAYRLIPAEQEAYRLAQEWADRRTGSGEPAGGDGH